MVDLINLTKLIKNRGFEDVQLLDFNNKKSKEWKLFEGIYTGSIKTDSEAIKLIYKENENSTGYKMLKYRLRKKLLNQLFFLDYSSTSYSVANLKYLELKSRFHQAEVLSKSSLFELSLEQLNQIVNEVEKFEFNNILDLCYNLMLEIYANINDKKKFYRIKDAYQNLQKIILAENESTLLYRQSRVEITHSVSSRKVYISKFDEVISKLESIWNQYPTYSTFENFYLCSSWFYELRGDYNKVVEITDFAEKLLSSNKINPLRFDLNYNRYIQVYANFRNQKYDEGLRLASMYEPEFSRASINWFAYMENYFLLAMHSKRYDLAKIVLQKVQQNTFITTITKLAIERWILFEAYLQTLSPTEKQSKKLQSLLQDLPIYSKDKEGYNVSILILQVIFYLQKKEFDAVAFRIESLKKYSQKYFKDDFSKRIKLFIKLLEILVHTNFDLVKSVKKGKSTFIKLSNTPTPGDGYAELEIVPYEHLWELIVQDI